MKRRETLSLRDRCSRHVAAAILYMHCCRCNSIVLVVVRSPVLPSLKVNCLKISPDKQFLAAAGNPIVHLFEISSQSSNPASSYKGHTANVTDVGEFQAQDIEH